MVLLREEVRGVGDGEAKQSEQGGPDMRPVVDEPGLGVGEVAGDAVDNNKGQAVEWDVEPAAEVVRDRVDGEIEDGGDGNSGPGA